MENFYVTLPSNSSMDVYPDNAISHYTTQLRQPLNLDGLWEVAIVEASVPTKYKNVTNGCVIRAKLPELLQSAEGTSAIKFKKKIYKAELEEGSYVSARQLANAMNRAWKSIQTRLSPSRYEQTSSLRNIFVFDRIEDLITLHKDFLGEIEVNGKLAQILGIGDGMKDWFDVSKNKNVVNPGINVNVSVNHIYVYSDLTDYVVVGDTVAPLLRIIPMQSNAGNHQLDHYTHIFNNPHYIPVSRHHIENIHIDLRTDTGENVPFVAGKCIVKLHFRRRRH